MKDCPRNSDIPEYYRDSVARHAHIDSGHVIVFWKFRSTPRVYVYLYPTVLLDHDGEEYYQGNDSKKATGIYEALKIAYE